MLTIYDLRFTIYDCEVRSQIVNPKSKIVNPKSQVPTLLLLTLDRLKQCLEVAFTEATAALALDDLDKQRRPILERLAKDLEQVAFIIAIHQHAALGQLAYILGDLPNSAGQLFLV